MLVTNFTRRALKFRREERELTKAGFRRHETDMEIHRGMRQRERILEARISCDGLYVYTRIGLPSAEAAPIVPPDMVLIPQEVIDKIEQWSRAYPTDVFPEPDFEKVHAALKAAGISIDSVSASNMRHVITKVWEMIAAAPNLRQTSGKPRLD